MLVKAAVLTALDNRAGQDSSHKDGRGWVGEEGLLKNADAGQPKHIVNLPNHFRPPPPKIVEVETKYFD